MNSSRVLGKSNTSVKNIKKLTHKYKYHHAATGNDLCIDPAQKRKYSLVYLTDKLLELDSNIPSSSPVAIRHMKLQS